VGGAKRAFYGTPARLAPFTGRLSLPDPYTLLATRVMFCPPNPKLLLRTCRTPDTDRATFGT
jgi:hypothetical protein